MSQGLRQAAVVAGVGIVSAMALLALAWGISGALDDNHASRDFKWDGARLLLLRENALEYTIEGRAAPTDAIMPDKLEVQEVPSALVPLIPYALAPWPVARVLWLVTSLVSTVLVLLFTLRLFAPGRSGLFHALIAALFVAGTPWRAGVMLGQHTLFSLAFFAMGHWCAERGRSNLAGGLLAVSLLKYSATLPLLLVFIYRKQYSPLLIALGAHLVMNLAAAAWLGTMPHVLLMQSLRSSSIISADGYLDPKSLFARVGLGDCMKVAGLLQVLAVLAAFAVSVCRRNGRELMVLSALSMLSMLMVYHRAYDYVILIFPLIIICTRRPGPLNLLLAVTVGMVFYTNSAVRVFGKLIPVLADIRFANVYYLVVSVMFYATTAAVCADLLRRKDVLPDDLLKGAVG